MKINQAAELSNLPVKTVRYYDEIGLVTPERDANDYRHYGCNDIHKLGFLSRARNLGFSIADCRSLLSLYEDKNRASSEVKAITNDKILEIEVKIAELNSLRDTLIHLTENCKGNNRPDCPILDGLAGDIKANMAIK